MKPFDLEAAKAGAPVCTRDGRPVRIICFDRVVINEGEKEERLVTLTPIASGTELVNFYTKEGKCIGSKRSNNDLFMAPLKKEGWINIYRDGTYYIRGIFVAESIAKSCKGVSEDYVSTIKIEWEE